MGRHQPGIVGHLLWMSRLTVLARRLFDCPQPGRSAAIEHTILTTGQRFCPFAVTGECGVKLPSRANGHLFFL
ncbi:hypothetical protein [Acidaminococcus intestini]